MDGNGRWARERNLPRPFGHRAELARAARLLAEEVLKGTKRLEDIDEEAVRDKLYTAPWSDPDLLIRTSGELRISNFLLWQLAYTELYMTPVLWPDVTRRDLFQAILDYQRRERRFGKVTAPTAPTAPPRCPATCLAASPSRFPPLPSRWRSCSLGGGCPPPRSPAPGGRGPPGGAGSRAR